MPAFAWISPPRAFATVSAFAAYLQTLGPAPRWVQGLTIHHTYRPTAPDWRGERTVRGLARYYQFDVRNPDGSRGWPAGPHLFIAPDGQIWQGTPLDTPGVHAGAWNRIFWGMEVVGDYDHAPWSPVTAATVYGVALALFRWRGLSAATPATLRGHRECASPKTCPGSAIDMDAVRAELQRRLSGSAAVTRRVKSVLSPIPADNFAAIREGRGTTYPVALGGTARLIPGAEFLSDGTSSGWAHIAPDSPIFPDAGFVSETLLEPR